MIAFSFLKNNILVAILLFVVIFSTVLPAYNVRAQVLGTGVTPTSEVPGASLFNQIITAVKSGLTAASSAVTSFNVSSLQIKEYVLDPLANLAAQTIIRAMTQQIIGWIQGDSAGFVQNIDQEFRKASDAAGGEFLNNLTGMNLCGNFGAFLRINLRTPGLKQRLECTVTKIIQNVNQFYSNFERGGWPAFVSITLEPQNNPYGAYLIALDAKIEAENRAQERIGADYSIGKGFLGFKVPKEVCPEISAGQEETLADEIVEGSNPDDSTIKANPNLISNSEKVRNSASSQAQFKICHKEYETKTPGSLIADGLSKSVYSGLDSALLADEINEAIAAIVTALLNKVISASSGGGGGVFDKGITELPPVDQFAPDVTSFFTQKLDDPILRAQVAQITLGTKIRTADETAKTDALQKLDKLNKVITALLSFRNDFTSTTDPNKLQNLNNDLNNVLVEAEQVIQDATDTAGGRAGASTAIDNVIEFANKALVHGAGAVLFLNQKINIATTTATTTPGVLEQATATAATQKKVQIEALLNSITSFRLKIIASRDAEDGQIKSLTSSLSQRIIEINAKALEAYKL